MTETENVSLAAEQQRVIFSWLATIVIPSYYRHYRRPPHFPAALASSTTLIF
jgi:hypothetical protein